MATISQGLGHLRSYSLTPSNVPATFRWNNQNKLGEMCENVFFLLTIAAILWNLQQLGRNFVLDSGTTHGICMQSIIGIYVIMRILEPA